MLLSRSREHLAPVNSVTTKANPIHLAVGDIDRDGKLDFVVAQAEQQHQRLLRGNGQFTLVCDLPAPNRPVAVALADFIATASSILPLLEKAAAWAFHE